MLQVSTQTELSVNRVISSHSSLSKQSSSWVKNDEFNAMRYAMLTYRKSGFLMTEAAWANMRKAIARMVLEDLPAPMSMELYSDRSLEEMDLSRCYGQFVRNPFEMVVSGYLYDMAAAERWVLNTFETQGSSCSDLANNGKDSLPWSLRHCREMHSAFQVFTVSRSGPLSAALPDAHLNESFADYLRRSDVDAGLLAEYIFAQANTLSTMRMPSGLDNTSLDCTTRVCFNSFYDDCNGTWLRLLETWRIPEPQKTAMFQAAIRSCPGADSSAQEHDSSEQLSKANISHPPEPVMVRRLRELDRQYLKGTLAALEEHLGCPVGGKYKESSY